MTDSWSALKARIEEMEAISSAMGVLEWDQQVMMPKGGATDRGRQMAALSGIYHERLTAPQVGELLDALAQDPDPVRAAAVRNLGRRYRRATQVPSRLVSEQAAAASEGFAAWLRAREARDFSLFQPALERLLDLSRQAIACLGPAAHPYDQLLEEYDPGATTADLSAMFTRLQAELSAFVLSLDGHAAPAAVEIPCTEEDTLALSRKISLALGFREEDGRLDRSEHPFTVGLSTGDVRITTHPYANNLYNTLWGTIHETGHAMYEQGLPPEWRGTTLCAAAGTGIHESQSRFWENFIARSLAFCSWLEPMLREQFPGLDLSAEQLYGAANRVGRSLIRVHADEATYNLHILVRFELEKLLVTGDLPVADLPAAWDDAYGRLLGVRPGHVNEGVLQDVHWSSGLFGYFPSYTVGNLYAASFSAAMLRDLPGLWDLVAAGQFGPILGWLREKVHHKGHLHDAPQIFAQAVGDRDPVADLMAHLRGRQGALYGVS